MNTVRRPFLSKKVIFRNGEISVVCAVSDITTTITPQTTTSKEFAAQIAALSKVVDSCSIVAILFCAVSTCLATVLCRRKNWRPVAPAALTEDDSSSSQSEN